MVVYQMGSMHEDLLGGSVLLVTRYKKTWEVYEEEEEEEEGDSSACQAHTEHSTHEHDKTVLGQGGFTTLQRPPALSRPDSVTRRKQTTQRCPLPFTRADDDEFVDHKLDSVDMATGTNFSRIGVDTLQRIGWASNSTEAVEDAHIDDEDSIYKITKVEFKRLSEQVKDAGMNLKNRFRSAGYQKLYSTGRPPSAGVRGETQHAPRGDSVSQVYHSQLAASLKAFQHKQWRPIKHDEFEPTVTRCRPISGRADRRPHTPSRPPSAVPTPPQRPRSVPPNACRPSSGLRRTEIPAVSQGNFDTLSPEVLADLLGSARITTFGDRINGTRFGEGTHRNGRGYRHLDDVTSGIDSSDESSDSDSDSEPPVDRSRPVPTLQLRPERMDSIYVPEDRRDRRRFDFDAENVDIPLYEFEPAIPEPFCRLDLKVIARQKYSWRDILSVRPKDRVIETIIDRMVEIEKLQSETAEWETKRIKARAKQRVSSAKSRDKRCCSNCLQPACVGDCPEKTNMSNTCTLCRQQLCTGSCQDTKYEAYVRSPYFEEQIDDLLCKPVPRVCLTCQKKHNAKLINANNAVLRRPKSGNMTYSRGRASSKPRDLRPRSVTDVTSDVIDDIEKLGIEPVQNRPDTGKCQRPRSRNAMIPGKSYFSNRKDSISEIDRATRKRKLRSLKAKRPKSVV